MDHNGLAVAARYSYPPNSLSLCGPAQQKNLAYYAATGQFDGGTKEILSQFQTLYPYLCFIAGENHLKDPFDQRVIEAYWLGNGLLTKTIASSFLQFMDQQLQLPKKLPKKDLAVLSKKIVTGAVPHHAFHVLNIYRRTGHLDIPHTVETMDACIINWGTVEQILPDKIIVNTKPLLRVNQTLQFAESMHRVLRFEGEKDAIIPTLAIGDVVSYHWGYICEKLTKVKLKNLQHFTLLAIRYANK